MTALTTKFNNELVPNLQCGLKEIGGWMCSSCS